MGWIDWLRYVLTPLLVAVLAASVATRNARKTPHERLKNLVDIHDKMPAGLDRDNVVEAAIVRELVDFDRRTAADQRGVWAGLKERAVQLNPITTSVVAPLIVIATVVGLAELVSLIDGGGSDGTRTALSQVVTGFVTALAGGAGYLTFRRSTRSDSQERDDQQATAQLATHLTTRSTTELAKSIVENNSSIRLYDNDYTADSLRLIGTLLTLKLIYKTDDGTLKLNDRGRVLLRRVIDDATPDDETTG